MEQLTMTKADERDRCVTAGCNSTMKKLTFLGNCMKQCCLCDARRPFRRTVKCSECKIVYHRRCGKKLAATGVLEARERDVRPEMIQLKAVTGADKPANAEATDAVRRVHDLFAADSAILRAEYTATDVRETTTVFAVPTLAARRPLPLVRVTIIPASEYFQYLLADETKRRKAATALSSVPRPAGPSRSRLTRADYLEMSASWDPVTFKKIKKNESQRVVYSIIFANTSVVRNTVDTLIRGP